VVSLLALALLGSACHTDDSTPATTDSGDVGVPQIPMPKGDLLSFPLDTIGPFHVGYRTIEITYTPPAQTTPRTIVVNLWYPTLDADGDHPAYLMIFKDKDALLGASLAPPVDPKGYPVHVYSHGSSGFGGTSAFMARQFASHGWVYVAPDHLGNTLGAGEGKRPLSIYYLRSTDITASLDALEHLDTTDPLSGKCRTKHVVMSGHSFGTLTTWANGGTTFDTASIQAKCDKGEFSEPCRPEEIAVFGKGLGDPRVTAGIPMAGDESDWIAKGGYDAPNKPYMLMTGTADVSGAGIFGAVTTLDLTWLEFSGGCHQLFALGGCALFEEKLGWSLVNTYALAFARRYLLGDTSTKTARIVSGEDPLSDRVTLKHKGATTPAGAP